MGTSLKITNIKILSFFILFFLTCCGDKGDDRLIFINNSAITIKLYEARNYPDTLQLIKDYSFEDDFSPNTSKNIMIKGDWEKRINGLPNGTIMFYIVNKDTFIKNPDLQYLIQNNKIEKRYDLTVDDLKKTNWTITFP